VFVDRVHSKETAPVASVEIISIHDNLVTFMGFSRLLQ
jgi:hypothetical protein